MYDFRNQLSAYVNREGEITYLFLRICDFDVLAIYIAKAELSIFLPPMV